MAGVFRLAAGVALGIVAFAAGFPAARAQSPAPMASPAAGASPAPTALPSPANPPENPLVTDRVRQEFNAWQRGRIERSQYSPYASGTYIDAFVRLVSPGLEAIGPLQSVQYRSASLLLGDVVYRYDLTGASGAVSVLYWLDPRGKTDGIVFTPLIFRSASVATLSSR